MMQEREEAFIVEVFITDVIADLHAQVSGAHRTRQLFAGGVDVLQWNLAQRPQSSFSTAAHFERNIVEHARAIQCMLRLAAIGEENRGRADHLEIDAITVHVFETDVCVPAGRGNPPEWAVAKHDHCFAWSRMFDPGPIRCAETGGQVRP
jgi:hypothetical protein